jgi:2-methylcitrate dehydratase PrpD
LDAAFTNSVLIASIAQEDFLFTFHPGVVNVPTAIAIGEREGSSGTEVLTALVVGYDIMGRIFLGGPNIAPRFRGVSAYGPFGAAATAGKLLKLNEDQLTSALGFAANSASGLTECWSAGTMEGNFHGGTAARNGIVAADLAKMGALAAETSLEGKFGFYQAFAGTTDQAEMATQDLGKRYLIMEAMYKPYPVCAQQQVPIDLLSRLVKQSPIDSSEIAQVIERVSPWEAAFPGSDNPGPFKNPGQTLLSAQFCAAAALLKKPVRSHRFYMSEYHDPGVSTLAKKIKLIGEKDRHSPKIEVELKDGRTYFIEEKGESILTPIEEKIRTKFKELTSNIIAEKKANEIIDIVLNLDKCSSIRELTQKLKLR